MPGAARRLLSDMGLLHGFLADSHMPRHALESSWGDSHPETRYAITDPDGHGWQIDRVRFEQQLRNEAIRRGATLLTPARVTCLKRKGDLWIATIQGPARTIEASSRIVLDASGRASRALGTLPRRAKPQGQLICFWARADNVSLERGVVQIEAEPHGWWYVSPLPGGSAIVAFHTDADLSVARAVRTREGLIAYARNTGRLAPQFSSCQWDAATFGICAADGVRRERAIGPGWIAVGDAAIAFDPIAAQGLFNALYLGLAAAEAGSSALAGDRTALLGYAAEVDAIWARYSTARSAWYDTESRWPDRPFWARRRLPQV